MVCVTFPGPQDEPSQQARPLDESPLAEAATRRSRRAISDPASATDPLHSGGPAPASASTPAGAPAQHVFRPRNALRIAAVCLAAALLIGTVVTAATMAATPDASGRGSSAPEPSPPLPAAATVLPAPVLESAVPATALCDLPSVQAALAAGDDTSIIAASGGPEALRAAVAGGGAPCLALDDPARVWVVVNKLRGYTPTDYAPSSLVEPPGVRNLVGGTLQPAAADALGSLVAAAAAEGVGEIALDSGYRSFTTQRTTYRSQVASRGTAGADLISARPGYSEHQSGLAADVVSCGGGGCSSIAEFASTPAGAWVAANSWRYGWIVRYAEGQTGVTGYQPEPWHLRYVGVDLARIYHDGGYYTLEQFFGLPVAPDYAD